MSFDADKFLNSTMTGPSSTAPLLCPEGEYKALVDDGDKAVQFKNFPGKDGKPDSNQASVLFQILDDNVKAQLKRDKVLVPMNIWLDMNEKGDALDTSEGRNVGIGRLRRALGQNDGTWSPLMMKGKGPVLVKVAHRADKNDPETKYAEVVRVAPITA